MNKNYKLFIDNLKKVAKEHHYSNDEYNKIIDTVKEMDSAFMDLLNDFFDTGANLISDSAFTENGSRR